MFRICKSKITQQENTDCSTCYKATKYLNIMKVLSIVPSIDISLGGPSYSTVNLCYALAQNGAEVALYTTSPTGEVPELTGNGYKVRYFRKSWPRENLNSNDMISEIKRVGRSYDVLDISSLWNLTSARAMMVANKI